MDLEDFGTTFTTLLSELVDGASRPESYVLNSGDPGLLRSLDKLSATAASAIPPTGSSIAAHVDHLRYGLSLMNRWSAGENPFDAADWSPSWRKPVGPDAEWQTLRAEFAREAGQWLKVLEVPRDVTSAELNGLFGSIAHLAYHFGA